jgi:hypothetical protein
MADEKFPNVPPPPLPGRKPPEKPLVGPAMPPAGAPPQPPAGQPGMPPAKPAMPGVPRPPVAGMPPRPVPPLKNVQPPRPGVPPAKPGAAKPVAPAAPAATGSPELDQMQQQMDAQVADLQRQLQEEREKLLFQKLRAKEEEAMSAKVEESLKDIQDRLRREKRDQELQENLSRAETQVKDLEQRMAAERQTWVETLKTQLTQREDQDRELERHFELQIKELERRWHEEKLGWSQAMKSREDELITLKRELEHAVAEEREQGEKRIAQLESEKESLRRDYANLTEVRDEERSAIRDKMEARDKEFLSLKAQQAMVITQLRQEKDKVEQLRQVLEKMRADKSALASQYEGREKEYFMMKTQFALYQARAKSEQEKLLKELVLFKDHMQKNQQQWEINSAAKEHELTTVAHAAERAETEYKAQLRNYEERLAGKEKELAALAEKDHEARVAFIRLDQQVKELSEKLTLQAASNVALKEELARRDGDLAALRQSLEQERRAAQETLTREREATAASFRDELARREREIADNRRLLEQERQAAQETIAKERAVLLAQIDGVKEECTLRVAEKEQSLADARAACSQAEVAAAGKAREIELMQKDIELREKNLTLQLAEQAQSLRDELSATEDERDKTHQDTLHVLEREIDSRDKIIEKLRQDFVVREKDLIYHAGQKVAAYQKELISFKDALTQKETEISAFREILEHEKKTAAETMARERGDIVARVTKLKENFTALVNEKETAARAARAEATAGKARITEMEHLVEAMGRQAEKLEADIIAVKQSAEQAAAEKYAAIQREMELLQQRAAAQQEELQAERQAREEAQALAAGKADEVNKLRQDLVNRDQNRELQIKLKDTQHEQELFRLAEKTKTLEAAAQRRDEETRQAVARVAEDARRREETLLAEKRMLEERFDAARAARSDSMEAQKRFADENKYLNDQLREKENALYQIKTARGQFEAEIRQELEQKYKTTISRLEKEKEDSALAVAQEIQSLRRSLQTELRMMEDQQETERADWRRQVAERQQREEELQRRIMALGQEHMAARAELESRSMDARRKWDEERRSLTDEVRQAKDHAQETQKSYLADAERRLSDQQKEIAQLQEELVQLHAKLVPQSAAGESVKNGTDGTIVLQPASGHKPGAFSRFWKSMNEPVIEIGSRADGKEPRNLN